MGKTYWTVGLAGVVVAVGFPLVGSRLRQAPENCCSLDRVQIAPIYRVRIVDQQGRSRAFCCIRCAEMWLEHEQDRPEGVYVTDEASGGEIDAAEASFVRSPVVTTATTGNRVHAFLKRADAEAHAAKYGGRVLTTEERPLVR